MSVSVVILTYNAELYIAKLLDALKKQTIKFDLVIIDSESSDRTSSMLLERKVDFVSIPKSSFNHGTTRNLALNYIKGDLVVYLTQDALPEDEFALENIVNSLIKNESVAIAYGKQLPYPDSTVLSSFARSANYPDVSFLKKKAHIKILGIKTCHLSNSFAAYDVAVLRSLGGFPSHCIMCEDVFVGAKAILAGYSIFYNAEAKVRHSHNYSLLEEFKRYFDIGVFYNREKWILDSFSKAESEGFNFVKNEIKHLFQTGNYFLIPELLFRTTGKYLGYLLGKYERKLPNTLKRQISMHRYYWQ